MVSTRYILELCLAMNDLNDLKFFCTIYLVTEKGFSVCDFGITKYRGRINKI